MHPITAPLEKRERMGEGRVGGGTARSAEQPLADRRYRIRTPSLGLSVLQLGGLGHRSETVPLMNPI